MVKWHQYITMLACRWKGGLNMLQAGKITALYCRLSQEDMQAGESESIQNQELLCKGWSHHLIHMTAVHLWQNGTLQLLERR